jgi:hypothetical protein
MRDTEEFVKKHRWIKPKFSDLQAGIDGEGKFRVDNTERLQEFCELNKNALNKMLETPSGVERQLYRIGDKLEFSEFGMYKQGTPVPDIVEIYVNNGYWYYVDIKGFSHRTKDLQKVN